MWKKLQWNLFVISCIYTLLHRKNDSVTQCCWAAQSFDEMSQHSENILELKVSQLRFLSNNFQIVTNVTLNLLTSRWRHWLVFCFNRFEKDWNRPVTDLTRVIKVAEVQITNSKFKFNKDITAKIIWVKLTKQQWKPQLHFFLKICGLNWFQVKRVLNKKTEFEVDLFPSSSFDE